MMAYEQSLKLFQRCCMDEMGIFTVDKVTENAEQNVPYEIKYSAHHLWLMEE